MFTIPQCTNVNKSSCGTKIILKSNVYNHIWRYNNILVTDRPSIKTTQVFVTVILWTSLNLHLNDTIHQANT